MKVGRAGERFVLHLFQSNNIDCSMTVGYNSDYDMLCNFDKLKFTCEIKFDVKSQETGNLAVEVHNTKIDKPSGLEATKSDIWIFVMKDGSHTVAFAANTQHLKEYIAGNEPKKRIEYAGDKNARIYLYSVDEILPSVFTRLDDAHTEDEIKARIRKLIKKRKRKADAE